MTASRSRRPRVHFLTLGLALSVLAANHPAPVQAQGPTFRFVTLAGRPLRGSTDAPGTAAAFFQPQGLSIGANGVIHVADTNNHVIRRIGTDGVVSTVAGLAGAQGSSDGLSTNARFNAPKNLVADSVGNVYVTDFKGVRKIAPDGTVSTLTQAFSGPAVRGIVHDGSSNLFVAAGHAVWRIALSDNSTSVFVGNQFAAGYTDATGSAARFNVITGLAIDTSGNLYALDSLNARVRKITPAADVTTVAEVPTGSGSAEVSYGLAVDGAGVLYVANSVNHVILSITSGTMSTLAGVSATAGSADGTGTAARFSFPQGITSDSAGTVYVADTLNSTIRKISAGGVVTTIAGLAGGPGNVDGNRTTARFNTPRALAVRTDGSVLVADANNCTIRSITSGGVTSTFAGTVAASQSVACGSTDATGIAAKFSFPSGVVIDASNNAFVTDTTNNSIRKITSAGVVTTFAGQAGTQGSTDATGTAARFFVPQGIAVSGTTLYVADAGNSTIRAITSAGVVTTLAGTAGSQGSTDATGSAARFSTPTGVAVDSSGNIYVADQGNHVIRKIASGGVVTTLAGTAGSQGTTDATGTAARFRNPTGVTVDSSGNIYVADNGNSSLRRVTSAGVVTTISSTVADYNDASGTNSRFNAPYGLGFDAAGNLYVADAGNHTIRVGLLSPAAPAITTSPSNQTVNAGATATFTTAATGNLTPSIQWQVSTNSGTTWNDLTEASPYSGTTSTTLTITSATGSLTGYRYRAVATNALGNATSSSATLTVNTISATPSSLRFGATKAGAAGAITNVTPAQRVVVIFSGTAGSWTATSNQTWAQVNGGSGTGNGQFTVAIANPSNVIGSSTTLTATITLTPSASNLSPVDIPVNLTVDQSGSSTVAPVGQVDTPAQNATSVVGAIGVTGWIVDDVGVASVKVYRNCLGAEPQANCQTGLVPGVSLVFVADAVLVPGARPDVEAAFPTYPAGNQAGWGVQVLTNMLPRTTGTFSAYGGEGPLTFYVIATDVEGHTKLLSRSFTDTESTPTTITMANSGIAKPFGAIDTPTQGGTVSGTFANFGWVLTPDANTTADGTDILVPTNGSTMLVYIDGAPVGSVNYNQCRGNVGNPVPAGQFCNDDIANIFGNPTPQPTFTARTSNPTLFRNLDIARSAIGSFDINTSTMTNGFHSFAWGVTDSAGRVEGIGSRNFLVLNTGSDAAQSDGGRVFRPGDVHIRGDAAILDTVSLAHASVWGRSGFDLATPYVEVPADAAGERHVRLGESDRLELQLGTGVDTGYLVANGTVRDLPWGSRLDTATGTFTWGPAPGYLGAYRLVFLADGRQIPVTVTIRPRPAAAGEPEIRMHVDSPVANGDVSRAFTVAGWSLDPQAFAGSGIGAVHVWAQRLDVPAAAPQFVGAATLGVARPDVAAAFGASHDRPGFSLIASLAPGIYDVTVYAWNQRTARWEDARTVRVTVR